MHTMKFELILEIFISILSGNMEILNGTKFLSRKRKIVSLTMKVVVIHIPSNMHSSHARVELDCSTFKFSHVKIVYSLQYKLQR